MSEKQEKLIVGHSVTPQDTPTLDTQEIILKIQEAIDIGKENGRKIDGLQKSADLIYKDRDILTEILGGLAGLGAKVLQHTQHQENIKDDIKVEIKEVGDKVKRSAEEVKDTIEYKTDQVKKTIDAKTVIKIKTESFLQKIRKLVS
jgi:hypothetical protein